MVYLATLLSMVNTYMISLIHQIIFYTSEDILATFFPICVIFTSFTFIIALAKTSSTIMIKRVGILILLLAFVEILWSFLHLARCWLKVSYICCVIYISCIPRCSRTFALVECWTFVKGLLWNEMIIWILSLSLFRVEDYSHWLTCVKTHSAWQMKPT